MSTKKIGIMTAQMDPSLPHAARLRAALDAKFPQFKFTLMEALIMAEGPWELRANMRPAMGTMTCWAEGYLQALSDASG
jgi:hypothetical protein